MITVRIDQTGDTAQAVSMYDALVAARTLGEDASDGRPWGFKPTASFFDADDNPIRVHVDRQTVWSAIGRAKTEGVTA